MSAKRISRRTAEQMFCGSSAGHPVAGLLSSAAAPGRADELSGEAEAVAAFQAARVDAPVLSALSEEHREKPSLRSLLAKALTAPVVGVVLAIGAVGGVAIAANGGVPGHKKEEKPRKSPSPTSTPTLTRKYAAPSAPAPAATPSTADLCRAYITQGGQVKHLAPLVKAAGGRKKVIAFCVTLLGWDKNKPNGQWPPQGWPTDWPTAWPQGREWPTEWPAELPKEWVRPPDLKQEKERRKARGEGSAERQSLWPEGWPELELWPR